MTELVELIIPSFNKNPKIPMDKTYLWIVTQDNNNLQSKILNH